MSRRTGTGFAASVIAMLAWGLYTAFLLLVLWIGPVGKDPQPPSHAEVVQGRLFLALGVLGFALGVLGMIAASRASERGRPLLLASGLFHLGLAAILAAVFLPDFPHHGRFEHGGAGLALVPIVLAGMVGGLSLNGWRRTAASA
jgi:hypothetical protein